MDEIVSVTSKLLLSCKPEEIEIEARIRRQLVNRHSVQLLIDNLDDAASESERYQRPSRSASLGQHSKNYLNFYERYQIGYGWEVTEYSEKRKISKNNRRCTYRSRTTLDASNALNRTADPDGTGLSADRSEGTTDTICKSSISREDVNDMWCAVHVSVEARVPSMQRALDAVEPVRVTRYRKTIDEHHVDAILGSELRVEVEACDARDFDPEKMMRVVSRVCAALQGNDTVVKYYDWKTVMHIANTAFGPFCIEKKHYQKPRTMDIDVLCRVARDTEEWAVTPKVDGVRRFLVGFNGMLFSLGTAKDVMSEGEFGADGVHVLDCEYAGGVYYAFDAPVYDGEYCGGSDLDERMSKMDAVVDMMQRSRVGVHKKPYEGFSSFDGLKRLYELFTDRYDMDGLVFSHKAGGYMQAVPKWKIHSTVDLLVNQSLGTLSTCDGYDMNTKGEGLPDGSFGVWEFAHEGGRLVAKRSRPDKPQANSLHIVKKNMYNSVPGTLFTGEGFYLMRKYHNRVKRWAIAHARDSGATLFDIGTGQGGDVGKWKRTSRVFCVEPDGDSLVEMLARCDDAMRSKITVINARLGDAIGNAVDCKVDIFTAFFCMNQWSERDWKALEDIVKKKGSKKCRLLAIAMTSPKKHESKNLEINVKSEGTYNIKMHGTRIMDIDETAVRPTELKKRMERCGMKMTTQDDLDTDDFMTADERKLSAMYTLFVFVKSANHSKSGSVRR